MEKNRKRIVIVSGIIILFVLIITLLFSNRSLDGTYEYKYHDIKLIIEIENDCKTFHFNATINNEVFSTLGNIVGDKVLISMHGETIGEIQGRRIIVRLYEIDRVLAKR